MSRFFDRRLLQQVQARPWLLALTITLGAVSGAAAAGQAFFLSRAITGAFLDHLDLAGVWPWLRALILISALRALAGWAAEIVASRLAVAIKNDLRQRLLTRILALGPSFTQTGRTGELVNLTSEGIEALDAYFSQYLPQVALAALIPVIFLIVIFPSDALSGLILLLTAPLIPLFMILIGSLADALTRRQWAALARLSAHFLDVLQGLTTLKLFNRSRQQIAVIRQMTDRHRDATLQVLRVAFVSALTLEMIGTLSTAIIAVEIGLRLLYGQLPFERAFFILILAPEYYLPLRQLGARFHAGITGVSAAQRIFTLLTAPDPPTARTLQPSDAPAAASAATAPIASLRNVSVSYTSRSLPALANVSLDIWPGEKVALVGPTGAGKSTVTHLLLGLVAPTTGTVSLTAAGPTVAWVPQRPHLFDATVADNIRLGRPQATLTEVTQAAIAACADPFIRALPQGYDTPIGEHGSRLSIGQAQRISLARALLLDAPLLILDEAAAHLDPQTEAAVQASLAERLHGRSALIISHRPRTLQMADRIIVLENGRIVETGTHDALLAGQGVYWKLQQAAHSNATVSQPADRTPGAPARPESSAPLVPAPTKPIAPVQPTGLARTHFGPFVPWIALSILLGFLTIASSIGLLATSAWIIAAAALQPPIATLQVAIVGVRFFGIARGVLRYAERLASHQVTFRILAQIRVWFYSAIEPLAPAGLAAHHSGDLLSRIIADIGALEHFFIRVIAPPFVALLVAALTAIILASFDASLSGPALTFLLLTGLGAPLLTLLAALPDSRRLAEQRASLNTHLVESIQGAADLIVFGASQQRTAALRAASVDLGRTQIRLVAVSGLGSALALISQWLAVVAVLTVAIPLVATARLSGVSLAVVALVTIASFEAVLPLSLAAQHLTISLAAARRLLALTQRRTPSQVPRPGSPTPTGAIETADPAVCFQDVTLRYAPGAPPALQRVSFTIPAGDTLAVVGPSGAGKTSLVNALLRFWDYEAGTITLGGRDLRDMEETVVRAQISAALQDAHLFNLTVGDNIRLAQPAATQAEVEAAARTAGIHSFILSLPHGYNTWIGEGGARLSGGERRKIALARAVLKNAPLLILDEPTAHLDTEAAREIMATLASVMQDRTTLLITHDLQLAQTATRILALDEGRVVGGSG